MDKNNIRKQLVEKFVNEATPGIDVTRAVLSKSKAFNDEGLKDIEKKLKDADKGQKKSASTTKDMPQNKFNYNSDSEQEYHQEMEIMNGNEMLEYDRDPDKMFKERAVKAIEGDSTMGNNPEWANVVPEQMGFTGPTFGKKLVKAIKNSYKKRLKATDSVISFGDDIETVSKNYAPMAKFSALNENDKKDDPDDMSQSDASGDDYEKASREIETKSEKPYKPWSGAKRQKINKTNNKPQIKEGMKRLKFKQEFKGVGNALKLIPESYKVDNKVFEMTDGVESYRMRWEGTLNEGKATVLMASDKKMVNEDIQKMKHLMGYKSQETLGTVKGKARIDENVIFSDIWKKSQILIEGEDIESQKAPEKKTDEKVPQSPAAKKHVQGSETTDKGTKAPAAKTGSADSLEKVKSQAPEAKKHVEGSVEKKVGISLGDQSEGEGNWDEVDMPQAPEAKKHVHMREGIQLGENFFAPMEEGMYEEGMYEEDEYVDYTMGRKDKDQLPNPPREIKIDELGMDEGMYEEGMYEEDMDEMYSFEEGDDMDEMDSLMEEEDDIDEMDSLTEEEDEE
jgi:hypothetical protein